MQKRKVKLVVKETAIYEVIIDTYMDNELLSRTYSGIIEQLRQKNPMLPTDIEHRKLLRIEPIEETVVD